MEELARNIWIYDGESVPFFCLPYSTRMTVVRLSSGELWVHSPIRLTSAIKVQLESLGKVTYLIAPNQLHHLFLPDWQTAYPSAQAYGTDEVIKKRTDIDFSGSLNASCSWPWQGEIEQLLFSGSPAMQECVFFHKDSKTLVVTDLVENFSGHEFNWWQKILAKGAGILAPKGKTPLDWRLSFIFGKTQARHHFEKMLSWQPKILVMAHGEVVKENTEAFLAKSFSWLK
ncbi:DUF4336 domain-containing protein [Aliiglaciecola sp. CAU 1673]|uniref:DUF4336 domain-containing protein n=1 Tax=Aliiglaciecola sp. CAU 1673 TaxID=3032595 RepID=UPI0023DA9790|nr:DUF4336 domain-containing protein [Aliiglaciecola sp. CAU 1673]MDF2179888.1 DUF4336 domain-containing protein [Aliiglaciecola sp. CAU 1673]